MQPEDDPRPDPSGGPSGAADWLDVVIPDDASELAAEVAAYRREQRAHRRRERLEQLVLARWRRLGILAPLTFGLLIALASVGSLLLLSVPRSQPTPAPQEPVAPTNSPGLVPDVRLDTGDVSVRLRSLRPAIVALVPAGCRCGTLLDTLAGQAQEFRLDLLVVGPPGAHEVFDLVRDVRRGSAVPFVDTSGGLWKRYAPQGVTALVLAPDATVRAVVRNTNLSTRLEPYLTAVLEPTARAR